MSVVETLRVRRVAKTVGCLIRRKRRLFNSQKKAQSLNLLIKKDKGCVFGILLQSKQPTDLMMGLFHTVSKSLPHCQNPAECQGGFDVLSQKQRDTF